MQKLWLGLGAERPPPTDRPTSHSRDCCGTYDKNDILHINNIDFQFSNWTKYEWKMDSERY